MKLSNTRLRLCMVVLFGGLNACPDSHAQLTGITVAHLPILLGDTVAFNATMGNAYRVSTYKWGHRCTGRNGGWIQANSNTSQMHSIEGRVGSQEVRCTVSYLAMGGQALQPTSKTLTISVPGPDSTKIVKGLEIPTARTHPIEINYQMLAGGKPLGKDVTGYVQEQVTPAGSPTSPWGPPAGKRSPDYYLRYDRIVDY